MRLARRLLAALAVVLLAPPAAAVAGPCDGKSQTPPGATSSTVIAPPTAPDPDMAPETQPDATLSPFVEETWSNEVSLRERSFRIPKVPGILQWDRVVLTFTNRQPGDAYDRLVSVQAGGLELLRMTTPRTPYQVQKDVTEVARALKPGRKVTFGILNGGYPTLPDVPAQQISTVRFDFYADEPTASRFQFARQAIPAITGRWLDGHGCREEAVVDLGSGPQSTSTIDITLSGHGSEEFWFCAACNSNEEVVPRAFHVLVDGTPIGRAISLPYVYALAGFTQRDTPHPAHPVLWWTAQREMDKLGVHTGVAEIPPFRLEVPADKLALLRGERRITLIQDGGARRGYTGGWYASIRVLQDLRQSG